MEHQSRRVRSRLGSIHRAVLTAMVVTGLIGGMVVSASTASASPPPAWDDVGDPRSAVGGAFIGGIDMEDCGTGLVVVGRGLDNAVWTSVRKAAAPGWTTWSRIPSAVIASPVLVNDTSVFGDVCLLYAVGTDQQLNRASIGRNAAGTAATYSGWTATGGYTPNEPSWLPSPPGFLMVVRGLDNALWLGLADMTNGVWSWINLGGQTYHRPAIARYSDEDSLAFVIGTDGQMWGLALGPEDWFPMGGYFTGAPEAGLTYAADGSPYAFVVAGRGGDGALWIEIGNGWQSLGGQISADPPTITQGIADLPLPPRIGGLGLNGRNWFRQFDHALTAAGPWTQWT